MCAKPQQNLYRQAQGAQKDYKSNMILTILKFTKFAFQRTRARSYAHRQMSAGDASWRRGAAWCDT